MLFKNLNFIFFLFFGVAFPEDLSFLGFLHLNATSLDSKQQKIKVKGNITNKMKSNRGKWHEKNKWEKVIKRPQ